MTEENYNYRTSQIMLRNQLPGNGRLNIPIIPKFQEKPGDFDDSLLIGFDKASADDQKHKERMVHFFLYDYRFERVWEKPDTVLDKLRPYRAVLSPDFSMYLEMTPVLQLYNVFRNRWCGAYWASQGLRVAQPLTGAMRRRLISASRESKKEALLPYRPTWHRHTTTAAIKRNGFWQATGKCCGGLSRRKLSAIIRRFRKWKATSSMSITSAARGGI